MSGGWLSSSSSKTTRRAKPSVQRLTRVWPEKWRSSWLQEKVRYVSVWSSSWGWGRSAAALRVLAGNFVSTLNPFHVVSLTRMAALAIPAVRQILARLAKGDKEEEEFVEKIENSCLKFDHDKKGMLTPDEYFNVMKLQNGVDCTKEEVISRSFIVITNLT